MLTDNSLSDIIFVIVIFLKREGGIRLEKTALFIRSDERVFTNTSRVLTENGFNISFYSSFNEIFTDYIGTQPDIIITDMVNIVADIRKWSDVPLVVITYLIEESYCIEAFESGADDYIIRPFSKNILLARINNALKHKRISDEKNDVYINGELEINFGSRTVSVSGKLVHLTPLEFNIAELLCRNSGQVLTYDSILKQIWGPYISEDNKILRVNMTNIRKKIERDSKNPDYFRTVSGVGYIIGDKKTSIAK